MALSASDKAKSIDNALRSAVYDGEWGDDVGRSYLSYTENLRRITESLVTAAENVESIERSLESTNETAGKSQLEKIKVAVRKL